MLATKFANAHKGGIAHNWNAGRTGSPDWAAFKANVPSVFAVEAHSSRSDAYGVVPTADILRALWAEGWSPTSAIEAAPRDRSKHGHQKHMVRLRRTDAPAGDSVAELIAINSFDGSTKFQLLAGVFVFVCANGLVTGDRFAEIRIPHRRNIVEGVVDAAASIGSSFRDVQSTIDAMRGVELTPVERMDFAQAAHTLRFPVEVGENGEQIVSPITPQTLLVPRRTADAGPSLWSVFNRVQENVIKGGLSARPAYDAVRRRHGRMVTTKEVKGIDQNVRLNRDLWTLAEQALTLKGVKVPA